MCANVAGKVVAKAVCSKLVGSLAVEAGGRQHGAMPRGGTEFPSHACRLFLQDAARTRRPAAVLFTDLASAFYSALPELALGAILTSQKRAQVFDALDITRAESSSGGADQLRGYCDQATGGCGVLAQDPQ